MEKSVEARPLTVELPDLNDHLINILGRPHGGCGYLAGVLRMSGMEIPRTSENEQAAVIHYLLNFYLKYGDGWHEKLNEDIREKMTPPSRDAGMNTYDALYLNTDSNTRDKELRNAALSIVRPSACDDGEIRLIIRVKMGKTVTVVITPEDLALALTGKSDVPVALRMRNLSLISEENKTNDKI